MFVIYIFFEETKMEYNSKRVIHLAQGGVIYIIDLHQLFNFYL